MIRVTLLAAAALLSQDPADRFEPGDTSGRTWTLFGPAHADDDTELTIGLRRVERRWDTARGAFGEIKSDRTHLRTIGTANHRRFESQAKAGPIGRYHVTVSTDTALIHSGEVAMGSVEAVFSRGPADVRSIQELIGKSLDFLKELERYVESPDDATPKAREDYTRRVGDVEKRAERILDETDFTGSLRLLLDALYNIRNAQVWKRDRVPPPATNDPPANRKHVFIEPNLTLDDVRKSVEAVRAALAPEIRASTTLLLERLFHQAGADERRLESVRSAARAAVKLAEAAPSPDADLVSLLNLAADKASKPVDMALRLKQAGLAVLIP